MEDTLRDQYGIIDRSNGTDWQRDPEMPADVERAVDYVLDDCFFAVGQAVGMRLTVEYDVTIWWRDHYRRKFLAAMQRFGNRWLQDRATVGAVAVMLAERAVRYAAGKSSIDLAAARQASADVERYCQLHARRRSRRHLSAPCEGGEDRIAGYWCEDDGG